MATRPRYESDADLEREARVADAVAEKRGYRWEKVPHHYAQICDVVMIDDSRGGEITCYCEVRCRKIVWGQYPDILVSVHKWMEAWHVVNSTRTKWMFAVATQSSIHALVLTPPTLQDPFPHLRLPNLKQTFGGRTNNPRDNADIEPVVHLPIELFKTINTNITVWE